MTTPIATAMLACHATVAASCRRVNPSVLNSASSRRRRRTEVSSVRPSADNRADCERGAEECRRVSHRAVVDDLGRPLHREEQRWAVTQDVHLGRDLLQRTARRGRGPRPGRKRMNTASGLPGRSPKPRSPAGMSASEITAPVPISRCRLSIDPIAGKVAVPTIDEARGLRHAVAELDGAPEMLVQLRERRRRRAPPGSGAVERVARQHRRARRAGVRARAEHRYRLAVDQEVVERRARPPRDVAVVIEKCSGLRERDVGEARRSSRTSRSPSSTRTARAATRGC